MIVSLNLRTSVHATEVNERVVKALMELLPEDLRNNVTVEVGSHEGYYGNPIEVLTVNIRDPQAAARTLNYILSRLGENGRRLLWETLEERVESSGDLYFRVNKQKAYLGSLEVDEGDDVVRVHVRFSGGRRKALAYYREALKS
ncbi:MAG: RNA-binding domain-containing protein [Thermoprotei archaeon]|nr:RNA-binding domain-containing protein [Thermoprotei archaeon]